MLATRALIVEVQLLDDRWHGVGDWPPSPFRVFQAMIAGAYGGRWRPESPELKDAAFRWLERLPPPLIVAPPKCDLHTVPYFVPNNDIDGFGDDPRRLERTGKLVRSMHVEGESRFAFVWTFASGEAQATTIADICQRLHTFGRGIDAAYARAEIMDESEIDARLGDFPGRVSRPNSLASVGTTTTILPCPAPGSLKSLDTRFRATASRFASTPGRGSKATTYFQQPPKARSQFVAYDRSPVRFLFDLRDLGGSRLLYPISLENIIKLAQNVRDLTADRLKEWLSDSSLIERYIVGRGTGDGDGARRVRFMPLPTIGHAFADPSIRRIIVEIPPNSTIAPSDIEWALSGQTLNAYQHVDKETGEFSGAQLVRSSESIMLYHYGITGKPTVRWRSVTPAVLPVARARGRLGGVARAADDDQAAFSVLDALRHAGVTTRVLDIRVQMEPFNARGARADAFDSDRFDRRRLRHVEIVFSEPLAGPLMIGDGRWLGLGLMRPVRSTHEAVQEPSDVPLVEQDADDTVDSDTAEEE